MATRVEPVRPPYSPGIAGRLGAMTPPGVPPILLFRTFARNLPMTAAMSGWGSYELSRRLSLPLRDREVIIGRTCARCRCEYEWGVHVAFFAGRACLASRLPPSRTAARAIHAGPVSGTGCSSRRPMPCMTPPASANTCGPGSPGCSATSSCLT